MSTAPPYTGSRMRGPRSLSTTTTTTPNHRWKQREGGCFCSGDINPACRGALTCPQSIACTGSLLVQPPLRCRLCCKVCVSVLATAPFTVLLLCCNVQAGLTGCKAHPSKLTEKRQLEGSCCNAALFLHLPLKSEFHLRHHRKQFFQHLHNINRTSSPAEFGENYSTYTLQKTMNHLQLIGLWAECFL